MLISLQWLREFVAVEFTAAELAERLTLAGLVVAAVTPAATDTLLDLEVTANRPDWLSHYGVAREVSALTGAALAAAPGAESAAASDPAGAQAAAAFPVAIRIDDPAGCARYCARLVEDVRVEPSAAMVATRLAGLGLRAINHVADWTNYVLLEIGQPTHAFDADKLAGGEIRARRARRGESLRLLDGSRRELDPEDLVIADAERPVALAGVMGGEETAIGPATRRVLIESAWFEPALVRRAARRHALHTDASHRFERGADPEAAPRAAALIAARLARQPGARVALAGADVYPRAIRRPEVELRAGDLRILGEAAPDGQESAAILRRLGFVLAGGTAGTASGWELRAKTPSWRPDVSRAVDLVEEVARVAGYDRFPARPPRFASGGARREAEAARGHARSALNAAPRASLEAELRARLRGRGYGETISLSFDAAEDCRAFAPEIAPVILRNPLSEEASILRTSALPALARALRFNLHHGRGDERLFELGKIYYAAGAAVGAGAAGDAAGATSAGPAGEGRVLTFGGRGRAGAPGWSADAAAGRAFDFFDLKGAAEDLLAVFAVEPEVLRLDEAENPAWRAGFHPLRGAAILGHGRKLLGRLGQLDPALAETWKIKGEVYLGELDLEALYAAGRRRPDYRPPAEFPAAERDFSFFLPAAVTWRGARAAIMALNLEALAELAPVEVFHGAGAPAGRYGLLLRARFQRADRTLREAEIQAAAAAIIAALEQLGGEQR